MGNGESLQRDSGGKYYPVWFFVGIGLFLLSNGNWMNPAAAWLAPVFLLRFFRTRKSWLWMPALFIIFCLATYFMLYGIIPPFLGLLAFILTGYYAVLWYIPYLVDRLIAHRLDGFVATLVFPAALTTVDYINGIMFGTWASPAYSQAGNLPLLQLVSVTGMWGVTFLIAWFGAVINYAWERKWQWKEIRFGLGVYFSVLAFVLLAGGARLTINPRQNETTLAAAFVVAEGGDVFSEHVRQAGYDSFSELARSDAEHAGRLSRGLFERFLEESKGAVQAGAEIIVWPEAMAVVMAPDEDEMIRICAAFSETWNIHLAISYNRYPLDYPEHYFENKTVLISPAGEVLWHYLKAYPVPGARQVPGEKIIPVFDSPFGRLGTAICYDMDFPHLINQAGKAGVDLMLVPAWDWREITPLHANMAAMRAIENGFALVRATGEGLSIAVDGYGRSLASFDYFSSGDGIMVAHVPTRGAATVYSLIGDLFAWICVAGLVIAIVLVAYFGITGMGGKQSNEVQQEISDD